MGALSQLDIGSQFTFTLPISKTKAKVNSQTVSQLSTIRYPLPETGLFIVKKLVDIMNSKVWCETELGQGATFIVEFPVADYTTNR